MSSETSGWLVLTLHATDNDRVRLSTSDGEVLLQVSRIVDGSSARVAIRAPKSVRITRTRADGRSA